MLFSYESDRPRSYRPDLVPAILKWVREVPDAAWGHFAGFEVTPLGGFVADFRVHKTAGAGPARNVRVQFDHNFHMILGDEGGLTAPSPQPFNERQLQIVADKF